MYEGLLGPGCLLLHVGGGWMYRGLMKAPGWGYGCVLIIMVSLTCRLLLEVRRSWEKTGEKAETESSKSVSHFEQQNTIGTEVRLVFFPLFFLWKNQWEKKSCSEWKKSQGLLCIWPLMHYMNIKKYCPKQRINFLLENSPDQKVLIKWKYVYF